MSICKTTIRTDADGRYCLNDLHRAAGGESKHQPAFWLRNSQTRALIEEIGNSANSQSSISALEGAGGGTYVATTGIPVVTAEGAAGGTYVAKELVYAYAMWISPSFHAQA